MTRTPRWARALEGWFLPRPRVAGPGRVPAGLYAWRRETPEGIRRFNLRVDESGAGLLLADASEALRLSPLACSAAKCLLSDYPRAEIPAVLGVEGADRIVADVAEAIRSLGARDRRYPAMSLPDPTGREGAFRWLEPVQADLDVASDPATMRSRIDWLLAAGIPHVRFLLNDDSPRATLVDLVEYAEDRGMIAGVRLRASEAAESAELSKWIDVGLDYVVIPFALTEAAHAAIFGPSDLAALASAIRRAVRGEIAAALEVGLADDAFDRLEAALARGAKLGGNFFETYAIVGDATKSGVNDGPRPFGGAELPQLAAFVEDIADRGTVPITFLPPVHVGDGPLATAQRLGPRTAGDLGIRIDVAGKVFLPRGPRTPIGDAATDDWKALRARPAFDAFRRSLSTADDVAESPGLALPASWADET